MFYFFCTWWQVVDGAVWDPNSFLPKHLSSANRILRFLRWRFRLWRGVLGLCYFGRDPRLNPSLWRRRLGSGRRTLPAPQVVARHDWPDIRTEITNKVKPTFISRCCCYTTFNYNLLFYWSRNFIIIEPISSGIFKYVYILLLQLNVY
jgi:hypothetical protein